MDNLGVHLRHFYLGSRVTGAVVVAVWRVVRLCLFALCSCDSTTTTLDNRRFTSLLLTPRSLVVVKNDTKYMHDICKVTSNVVDNMFTNMDLHFYSEQFAPF